MASSWSNKLETRLSALADGASKESIQSLAKWIGFNRKHMDAFCVTLNNSFAKDTEARKWLLLCIIHEVLLLEKDNATKWDRLSNSRVKLGESVVIPALEKVNDAAMKERVSPLIDEWESANSFDSPTLVNEMRKALASESSKEEGNDDATSKPAETAPAALPKKEEPTTEQPSQDKSKEQVKEQKQAEEEVKKEGKKDVKMKTGPEKPAAPPSKPPLSRSSSIQEDVPFDFEATGIPYSKVESREFLEPCKAIATLQIARDLRNDAAVQLSSRLSALPDEVKEFCRKAQEQQQEDGSTLELLEEQAQEFAKLIGDDLLDTDMEEALVNVKTFMSIVEQQKQARLQLIQLLIQSRCQFGSEEAAKVFYSLDGLLDELKKRKQLLSDAMDLEGFEEGVDFKAHDPKETDAKAAALEPLSWYKPADEPDAKRAKIE